MLNEHSINAQARRRALILLPTVLLAAAAACVYMGMSGAFLRPLAMAHWGADWGPWIDAALIPAAVAIFLIPSITAEWFCKRFTLACPNCGDDLTRRTSEVTGTRQCPTCGHRIVAGGRCRSRAVYQRHQRRRQFRFLSIWLWVWPALGLVCLGVWAFDQRALADCQQVVVLGPLVGAVAAGWTWLRTRRNRFLPAFLCSALLMIAALGVMFAS